LCALPAIFRWSVKLEIDMEAEQQDRTTYLTLADVEMFHRDQLDRHGGQDGFRNRAAIEAAVDSPRQTMFGEPLYPDLAAKASVYLFQISESQGFVDGNKRTGVVAAAAFLLINGYEIAASSEELYDMAIRMAQGQLDRLAVANWIRDRLVGSE
jgi:death-on-curing protein